MDHGRGVGGWRCGRPGTDARESDLLGGADASRAEEGVLNPERGDACMGGLITEEEPRRRRERCDACGRLGGSGSLDHGSEMGAGRPSSIQLVI